MFNKILIANRGEIACACGRDGQAPGRSAASPSTPMPMRRRSTSPGCDEAVHVGGSAAGESYLASNASSMPR